MKERIFEMANSDNPEEIVAATQSALIKSMMEGINGIKEDFTKIGNIPGMTWEQIDYFLQSFKDKKPIVINQEFVQ